MLHAAKNFVALEKFQKQPPEVSYKEGVPKNFAKFTGKHLNQSLFFNKVAGMGLFSCDFVVFLF